MSLELQTAPAIGTATEIPTPLPPRRTPDATATASGVAARTCVSTSSGSALVVAWLGSWQLAGTYWIDPFFFSKPSAIWDRLVSGSPRAPPSVRSGCRSKQP